MPDLPDWLSNALPEAARHPGLAIASLGDGKTLGKGGFKLWSPAFGNGEVLDPCFTAVEEDAVAPPLEWTAPPPGSQEIVIIVEEASSDNDVPPCQWALWGLPGQKGKLLEGEVPPRAGKNALGNSEWLLPDPPIGETRHYVFQIFSTDLPLTLMPGASVEELKKAIQGFVTGCAVLYAPFTGVEAADADFDENFDLD
ncbi:YbhB and YbcL [Erythrobacter longus]|uniref:YbhB and YbcL n=1 Tax=Erythrobacter longus TaxID=1044 RepID=A0A074MBL8_ERYLO|nr:YbhB/YbcL family Raf kinase inhibitor-like protein [Erythrobacter longus]KEO92176.1 YbhB and YbcL [Erythrobacter longus]